MPAPLAVNREAVKAHAITHGIREAARAFELSEDTVKSWAKRDGWLDPCRAPIAAHTPLPLSIRPKERAPNAPSPSQAARNSEAARSLRSKLHGQRYVERTLKHAASLDGETALAAAQSVKAVAGTGQIVFKDWQPDAMPAGPLVSFTLHAGVAAPEVHVEPVMDV